MLSVLRVHLPSEIPIVGCEITPHVLLKRPDNSISNEDVPESAPIGGYCMRYKWYRSHNDSEVAVCSVHPTEQATLMCFGCVKMKIPVAKSCHCSTRCFADACQHHRVLHERALSALNENGNKEEELYGRTVNAGLSSSTTCVGQNTSLNNNSTPLYPATVTERRGGETWFEVGRSRTYTPTAEDIGCTLKFECAPIDAGTKNSLGIPSTFLTSRVILAPSPTSRCMIPANRLDVQGQLNLDGRTSLSETFSVLSYDAHATSDSYSYYPSLAGYHADIVCPQEVESNHFDEFLASEPDKHGCEGLFKKKTFEVYNGNPDAVDGCATFFFRDKFSHVKKYEVKAALYFIELHAPSIYSLGAGRGSYYFAGWMRSCKAPVPVLVDSGSDENYIDVVVAERAGLSIVPVTDMLITAANGMQTKIIGTCNDLSLIIQGEFIEATTLRVFDMGVPVLLLGVDWMESQRSVVTFDTRNKELVVQVEKRIFKLKPETKRDMMKPWRMPVDNNEIYYKGKTRDEWLATWEINPVTWTSKKRGGVLKTLKNFIKKR